MMGYPFAVQFAAFASQEKCVPIKSIAKVKDNPGQSKHLETAKASVLGLELDFVNLRDEEYADDSRIPTKVVRCVLYCETVNWTFAHRIGVRRTAPRSRMRCGETQLSTPCSTTCIHVLSRIIAERYLASSLMYGSGEPDRWTIYHRAWKISTMGSSEHLWSHGKHSWTILYASYAA